MTLQITGELLDNITCWDVLRAAFPAGTVSGAPKVINPIPNYPILVNKKMTMPLYY